MNTTDLHTLLTAPIVSRATFFARYLGTTNGLTETPDTDPQPAEHPAADQATAVTEPVANETNR